MPRRLARCDSGDPPSKEGVVQACLSLFCGVRRSAHFKNTLRDSAGVEIRIWNKLKLLGPLITGDMGWSWASANIRLLRKGRRKKPGKGQSRGAGGAAATTAATVATGQDVEVRQPQSEARAN
jgi:hypothetical protein